MLVYNINSVVLSAVASVISFPDPESQIWFVILIIHFLLGLNLITAVLLMRRAVFRTNFAQPNNRLVKIHLINFSVVVIATLTLTILQTLDYGKLVLYSAQSIQYTILVYTNIFLLYLIEKFTRENTKAIDQVNDPILGKKVPNIVLLQNQKLLSEAVTNKL